MTDSGVDDRGSVLTPDEVLAIITGGPKNAALPRHRHSLTAAHVEETQRWRIIAAAAEVIARRGFSSTTVDQISAEAGVSKKSFYKFFADKEAAFIAAYEVSSLVTGQMARAVPAEPTDLDELLTPLLRSYLDALRATPAFAVLTLLRAQGATPGITQKRIEGFAAYAEALKPVLAYGRERGIPIADITDSELVATLAGVNELCSQQVHHHGIDGLDGLEGMIMAFVRRVLAP